MKIFIIKPENFEVLYSGANKWGTLKSWAVPRTKHSVVVNAGMFVTATGSPIGTGALVADGTTVNRFPTSWPLFLIRHGKAEILPTSEWKEYWDLDTAQHAVSCAPLLIWNGNRTDIDAEIKKAKITGVNHTASVNRTAIGYNREGNIIVLVMKGTLKEVQERLWAHDTVAAINLDGGGSTCVYENGSRTFGEDVRKYPSALAFTPIGQAVPNPTPKPKDKLTVCIDPGHQSNTGDVGARGNGLREEDITLKVGKLLKFVLEQAGVNVVMTREEANTNWFTEPTSLRGRVNISNNAKADVFVSIHCNSHSDPSAHGTETFVVARGGRAEKTAIPVQRNLVALGMRDRGVKVENFHVLRETNAPAILVELGFMTNPKDALSLSDPTWRARAAWAIAEGLAEEWGFSLAEPTEPTPEPEPDKPKMTDSQKLAEIRKILDM